MRERETSLYLYLKYKRKMAKWEFIKWRYEKKSIVHIPT